MTKDQKGFAAVALFIIGVIAGVLSYTMLAWLLIALGVALIIYAQFTG